MQAPDACKAEAAAAEFNLNEEQRKRLACERAMTTYVAFDGDKDIWAYRFMRGWSANKRIDFELLDAHDLDNMTDRARGEYYVKGKLLAQFALREGSRSGDDTADFQTRATVLYRASPAQSGGDAQLALDLGHHRVRQARLAE